MTFVNRVSISLRTVARVLFFPFVATEFVVVSYVLATLFREGHSSPTFWGFVGCLIVLVWPVATAFFDGGLPSSSEPLLDKEAVVMLLLSPFWPVFLVVGCAAFVVWLAVYLVLYLPANWLKWLITGERFFASDEALSPQLER